MTRRVAAPILVPMHSEGPEICEKTDDGSTGTAPNRISRKGNHHGVVYVLDPSFKELGVMNGNTTEEVTFNVGSDEVLKLLVCSLVSKTPLTEALLKSKPIQKLSNENQVIDFEPEIAEGTTNPNGNISIKLIVSKSKKMVSYAEVREDFALRLLVASFVCDSALTNVFIREPKQEQS